LFMGFCAVPGFASRPRARIATAGTNRRNLMVRLADLEGFAGCGRLSRLSRPGYILD
jgi:hypothetical protein